MDESNSGSMAPELGSHFSSVPIEITISVGRARPTIRDLLKMTVHTILPLDRKLDDPVELYVGDKLIARGELQEMEGPNKGQLAVCLTEVLELKRDFE
jgi:flagellar motor switch protein FliN/FliY